MTSSACVPIEPVLPRITTSRTRPVCPVGGHPYSAAMPFDTLSRCNPADQGVSSAGVGAFLDVLEAAPDIELHSLMLVRGNHVVAEGWWWPYTPERVHLLYSLSKSFTATAAGLAAAEGLLGFDDPVVSHFPDLADGATPRTGSVRVRRAAVMATGRRPDPLGRAGRPAPEEPVRGFLALEPEAEPG